MLKKKSRDLDQPVTQRQFEELINTIREMGTDLFETMRKGFKEAHQELQDFRLEEKHNWEDQWQFNKEISQKVDLNTDSIRKLKEKSLQCFH
jgi:histidinol dehydrogenase